jgi:acyl carrier protein|tara:strand:- start:1224 stop:1466 length:243 start_codon:yes stop_codon:yes gene_type:complete
MSTLEKVKELLYVGVFVKRSVSIESDSTLDGDLLLDSLDKVELVMVLEEEFDIEIPTEKFADAVVTIGDICELVQAISIK